MPINVLELWDFANPTQTEDRFRTLLPSLSFDEQLIATTQIARTYGLRKQFDKAREVLGDVAPHLNEASAEVNARYHLELGRTLCSPAHTSEQLTDEAKSSARASYTKAFEIAKCAKLDYLAIDALHMMVMVDQEPAAQLGWNRKAIEYMEQSSQPDAKKWEGSLRNNVGYALHLSGDYEGALKQFQLALTAREAAGKAGPIRIAHWMIAWTYRAMGRIDEALTIQHRLEQECDEDGSPDPYVYEELEHLYRAKGDDENTTKYKAKREQL